MFVGTANMGSRNIRDHWSMATRTWCRMRWSAPKALPVARPTAM
jgi:hypothetical protein